MAREDIPNECKTVEEECGLPAFDTLEHGALELMDLVKNHMKS